MAHAETLTPSALASLAAQLALWLPLEVAGAPAAANAFEIAESLPIWSLKRAAIRRPDDPFHENVLNTRRWHHQIREAGTPRYVARSKRLGNRAVRLLGVAGGDIAERMARAIAWIDEEQPVQHDCLARLLVIPAYFTIAIWLDDRPRHYLVLVESPVTMPTPGIHVPAELLRRLVEEMPERHGNRR